MILILVQLINYDKYYQMMIAGLYKRKDQIRTLHAFLFSSDEEGDETVISPENNDDGKLDFHFKS